MTDAAHNNAANARVNTLGWSQRELNLVLDHLEAADRAASGGTHRREFARWPFRKAVVPVLLTHPGGTQSTLKLACRNISRGGMSLLHNGYIYPGSAVRLTLPRSDGGFSDVDGLIKRCIHRRGVLHEIGVQFKRPIHLRDYLVLQPTTEFYSLERVTPESIKGKLLLVEDSQLDVSIIKHLLRQTSLQIKHVETVKDADEAVGSEEITIILCDAGLPDERGTVWLQRLRERGNQVPAIITSADTMAMMRENAWQMRGVYPLPKPVSQEALLRTLAECLLLSDATNAAAAMEHEQLPEHLTERLRGMLSAYVTQLREQVDRGAIEEAMVTTLKIKGAAPSLGLPGVAQSAEVVVAHVSDPKEQQIPHFKALLVQCDRELSARRAG